jgi:hypothetical protein
MNLIDLSQFASLFEIGFALHFAVAFIDRIYARELPARIISITSLIQSIERFKQEIDEGQQWQKESGKKFKLRVTSLYIENPIWIKHNDNVLDQLRTLSQEANGQIRALKGILSVITFLSVLVALYSVTMLFMIGFDVELLKGLDSMTVSMVVLMQLLPLPVAASIFFFVARRMSKDADRKIRSVSELNLMLNKPSNSQINRYVSVDQIYRRDLR